MFCAKCGAELSDNMRFCPKCGAEKTDTKDTMPPDEQNKEQDNNISPEEMMKNGQKVTENIVLCEDGKYRWVYKMGLFTNPSIFFLVWKIFFFIMLGIFVFIAFLELIEGDLDGGTLLGTLTAFLIGTAGMTALTATGYLVYAHIMGGKYIVMFEMDDDGVNHKQVPEQAKKARAIGELTSIAGAAAGNATVAGIGQTSQRTEMYSDFAYVKKVRSYPATHTVKLDEPFCHNQVYAAKEDFEFVKQYIYQRCVNASVKK